jgi:transcriptional pleiotropic regulator of transition state genes
LVYLGSISQKGSEKPCLRKILRKRDIKMKETGILRPIDELGRIVIPKTLRKKMGLTDGVMVEIFVEGERIILTKATSACAICGRDEELVEFCGANICRSCIEKIKAEM